MNREGFWKREITKPVIRKSGQLERYEDLIKQNKLLFSLDLIKYKLSEA